MQQPKALIAMSGGVDSSVAAYLTAKDGYSCIGGTMLLYDSGDVCGSSASIADARDVAGRLNMPFHVFELTDRFNDCVIQNFVDCYENGLTPNPCVCCNRHLKFSAFLEKAKELNCECMVTGHYARIVKDAATGRYLLCKAMDSAKDQSYFLYAITQEQLKHIRFPLGELTKDQVRSIAQEQNFINAKKRDSQDICFVPDGDYYGFLRRFTGKDYPCGDFLDTNGNKVGTHQGAAAYTLGQRKGLGLAMGQPVYVCSKDMQQNTVTVGTEDALFHKELLANDWFFFPFETLKEPMEVEAKTRSRMAQQPATVYPEANGFCRVVFHQPQRAITPGQAVVLYDGDVVVGGGTITQVL